MGLRHWPAIVRIASITMPVWAVVLAILGVVSYATAESQPEFSSDTYVPSERIDIPGAYRWDGMVLWGKPAAVDLSGITCRVVWTTRERELLVGPREVDEELAMYTDSAHGEVAYLASTSTVLGHPSAATCEGDGLEQVVISADRDVEGSKRVGRLWLTSAALFLVFGLVLGLYSRSLSRSRHRS